MFLLILITIICTVQFNNVKNNDVENFNNDLIVLLLLALASIVYIRAVKFFDVKNNDVETKRGSNCTVSSCWYCQVLYSLIVLFLLILITIISTV